MVESKGKEILVTHKFDTLPSEEGIEMGVVVSDTKIEEQRVANKVKVVSKNRNDVAVTKSSKLKSSLAAGVSSPLCVFLTNLFLVWSIFNDDLRLAYTDIDADEAFVVIISIIFFLFLFEIVILW